MIYPKCLNDNDMIGITAPSNGLVKDTKVGALENASGIMFGRLKNEVSYTGISLHEAISRAIKNENIPILTDIDLGHTNP